MPNKHSGGPGTYTQRGVRCTMDAPMGGNVSTAASGGINNANKAPFDKPKSMGNGGIPERFYDAMPSKMPTTVTAGQVSPPIGSTQNVGQRRFKNPT